MPHWVKPSSAFPHRAVPAREMMSAWAAPGSELSTVKGSLVAIVLGLLLVAASGCGRLDRHPLVVEAAEEVRGNDRVGETLGSPVACGTRIRGVANERDGIATLEFDASGPRGSGIVVVEGKKTAGQWGVTHLELRPAAGGALKLTADLEARTGVDTPRFDPTAVPVQPSNAPPPPAEIDIVLPPVPGSG
jgi:hypothetical protein